MVRIWSKAMSLAGCAGLGLVGWALSQPPTLTPPTEPTLPSIPVIPKPTETKGIQPATPKQDLNLPTLTLPAATPPVKKAESKPLKIEPITEPKPRIAAPIEPTMNKAEVKIVDPPTNKVEGKIVDLPLAAIKSTAQEMGVNAKQEPSVALEWLGPASVKLGMAADYSLNVRNTCASPVQKVVVQVRLPKDLQIAGVEPKADNIEGILLWELGTLMPKQEKQLKMKMLAPGKGELNCQAWVTFTGSTAMKLMVREPKLSVKATVPDKVLMGDPANISLTISNPGDSVTDSIKLTATLAEGLEGVRGNKMMQEIGSLAPGETRTIQLPCVTKTGGSQKCEVFVEAEGGLKAMDTVAVNVVTPQLNIEVLGPKLRYLDRKAVYTVKVTNPGDAPASNVFVTDVVPAGFKFVQADAGGQMDNGTSSVKWFLGELAPGASKEVKVELLAVGQGELSQVVTASGSRGVKTESTLKTKVEGLSAIQMEVVDTEDPLEAGHDTIYEIRVTNTGSKTEEGVKIVCTIPPQLKLKTATGPVKFDTVGNEVVFETMAKLAPKADAVFKITCTGVAKGDARFKAQLSAASLVEPVIKQESTKVYED